MFKLLKDNWDVVLAVSALIALTVGVALTALNQAGPKCGCAGGCSCEGKSCTCTHETKCTIGCDCGSKLGVK